jgi:peptidoglycan/xylan/chitin deacetylase (PgdA/CDA1 family)
MSNVFRTGAGALPTSSTLHSGPVGEDPRYVTTGGSESFPLGTAARLAGNLFSAISGARLTILIYHRVLENPDPLSPDTPDAAAFERAMSLVKSQFRVIALDDAVRRLRQDDLPSGCAAITFDDGYADNSRVALPILQKLGLTATFFVAAGFLNGGRMWNDTVIEAIRLFRGEVMDLGDLELGLHAMSTDEQRRVAIGKILAKLKYFPLEKRLEVAEAVGVRASGDLPTNLMMTTEEVRELQRSGMTVGGHTVSHPILTGLDADSAEREIVMGKRMLEEIIEAPVQLFAFPNGQPGKDYSSRHVELVKRAGFGGAVSTAHGVATVHSDPFQLPRFTPWRQRPVLFRTQLLKNLLVTRPKVVQTIEDRV